MIAFSTKRSSIYPLDLMQIKYLYCLFFMKESQPFIEVLWMEWPNNTMVIHGVKLWQPISRMILVQYFKNLLIPNTFNVPMRTITISLGTQKKVNFIEWSKLIISPFLVGGDPTSKSTLVCKVYHTPICLALCDFRIYHVTSYYYNVTCATIHLGWHVHHESQDVFQNSLNYIYDGVT